MDAEPGRAPYRARGRHSPYAWRSKCVWRCPTGRRYGRCAVDVDGRRRPSPRSADARDMTGEVRQREATHDASRRGVRARYCPAPSPASPTCAAGMDSARIGIFLGTGKAVMDSLRQALARGAAAGVGTMTGRGAGEARSGGGGLRGPVPVGDIPDRARRGSTARPGGPDCAGRAGTTPETIVKTSGYAGLQAARDGSARDGLTPDNCCYRASID